MNGRRRASLRRLVTTGFLLVALGVGGSSMLQAV